MGQISPVIVRIDSVSAAPIREVAFCYLHFFKTGSTLRPCEGVAWVQVKITIFGDYTMSNDLNAMSRKELLSLRTNVEKALSTVAAREKKAALEAAERAAAEHGFTLAELQGASGGKAQRAKPKSPAKYRNPTNAADTWSGRGRKPHWVLDLQKSGKNLEDYMI